MNGLRELIDHMRYFKGRVEEDKHFDTEDKKSGAYR